jgi:glycosyltransferase involved in cell wall biosynthesis
VIVTNILILTSVYPEPDDEKNAGVTPVVQYFAKEWAKLGHRILVIHNACKYPLFLYLFPNSILQDINSRSGMVIPNRHQRKDQISSSDDFSVYRLPMLKIIPKSKFSAFQIKRQYKKIINILGEEHFIPDVAVGHWENPQIPLLSLMKQKFGCRTSMVFHSLSYLDKKSCGKWVVRYLPDIDRIGCRSNSIAAQVKCFLRDGKEPFINRSGIPEEYVSAQAAENTRFFTDEKVDKFIFTGQLIERKNIDCIIRALCLAYPNKGFHLDIVGIGACESGLRRLTHDLGLQEQVDFCGRVERTKVINMMRGSQCFVMISRDEAFGLVYLEAMASGCIVVASRNEGADGIIMDVENGFLCNAGDEKELACIFTRINRMTAEQKERISDNGIHTAGGFTDSEVAKRYLENIMQN